MKKKNWLKLLKQDEFIKQVDFSSLDFVKCNSRAIHLMGVKTKLKDVAKHIIDMLINKLKLEFSEAILKIVENIERFFAS